MRQEEIVVVSLHRSDSSTTRAVVSHSNTVHTAPVEDLIAQDIPRVAEEKGNSAVLLVVETPKRIPLPLPPLVVAAAIVSSLTLNSDPNIHTITT